MNNLIARLVFGCLSLTAVLSTCLASDKYPTKAIRLIVPFPPGGGNDATARILGSRLSELLEAQIVIDNRPGAGGSIGSESVARAAPDGYVLLMASNSTHAINPGLYAKLPYDPVKDFEPIVLVASAPNVLVVHPSIPATTVKELIDLAKRDTSRLTYASAGSGTTQHLAGELFKSLTGTSILHIPYKGAGPAMADLLGGQVSMAFDTMPSALPHVLGGKLLALGVAGLTRSPNLPNVPSISETIPAYEVIVWFGMFAPRGTPPAIIQQLNRETRRAIGSKDVQDRLKAAGLDGIGSSAEDLAAQLAREIPKWRKVIEDSGAKVD